MSINVVNLVKGMLPDAIKRTDRDTFIFSLDGEEQVFPSYRTAAHSLGASLGLGKRHVALDEVQKRLGHVRVVYSAPQFDARDMATPPPKSARTNGEQSATVAQVATSPPNARKVRQARASRVVIPAAVMSDLLRTGRAKIILAIK